jgi:hypothetical protein
MAGRVTQKPLVVAYDDNSDVPIRAPGLRGSELRGDSEYLRVRSGEDLMTEDQLDRLMKQNKQPQRGRNY